MPRVVKASLRKYKFRKVSDYFPLDYYGKTNVEAEFVNDKHFLVKGSYFYIDYYDRPLSGVVFYSGKYHHFKMEYEDIRSFVHEDDKGEPTDFVTYSFLDIYQLKELPEYYSQKVHDLFNKYDFSKDAGLYSQCIGNNDKYPFDDFDYSLMNINPVCYNIISIGLGN